MSADASGDGGPSLPALRLVELLQWLGEKKGMSQAQVARQANVPSQYLSDVRNERRPLTELFARRLADEFGCNFQWLLGLEDSPERTVQSVPPAQREKIWLPLIDEAIAGEPREHPRWNGAHVEVSGIAATKAARAVQPYVLLIDHDERESGLRKGDLLLVSQATAENAELSIVRCGQQTLLARKKGAKWLRVATGEPLRGDYGLVGHCLGVVWSALI
jgi:transcriptional regulator with XRE-family HTH domain